MPRNQFCLKWDSYHKEIASGLAHLQHSEEFVDMTLAAEGHFVKVHKNLIALASPYLKEMICSAPCAHPIVYLYNINHQVLCYILEYIYTGEVQVPNDLLTPFLDASKALCIVGVKDVIHTKPLKVQTEAHTDSDNNNRLENFAGHITINSDNYNLEVNPVNENLNTEQTNLDNISYENTLEDMPLLILQNGKQINHQGKTDNTRVCNDYSTNIPNKTFHANTVFSDNKQPTSIANIKDNGVTLDGIVVSTDITGNNINQPVTHNIQPSTDIIPIEIDENETSVPGEPAVITSSITKSGAIDLIKQYSVSSRGALQLILNRFIYYCHHQSFGNKKRRWRCIDYRKLHCPAYIDTDKESITSRKGVHCHTFHDNKILKKSREKNIYTSIPKVFQDTTKNKSRR